MNILTTDTAGHASDYASTIHGQWSLVRSTQEWSSWAVVRGLRTYNIQAMTYTRYS